MISLLTILSVAIAFYKYENRSYKSNRDLKEKIYFRIDKLKKNFLNSLNPEEFEFWKKIEDLNSDGYFVTTFSSSERQKIKEGLLALYNNELLQEAGRDVLGAYDFLREIGYESNHIVLHGISLNWIILSCQI